MTPNIPTRPFIYATSSHTCHLQALPLTRGLHSEPCAPLSCLPVLSFVNVCELKSSDLPHTLGPLHVKVPADAPCQSPVHTRSLHYVCLRDVHTPSGALTTSTDRTRFVLHVFESKMHRQGDLVDGTQNCVPRTYDDTTLTADINKHH